MNHFKKIAEALPGAGLDGVLLTGEHNRFCLYRQRRRGSGDHEGQLLLYRQPLH